MSTLRLVAAIVPLAALLAGSAHADTTIDLVSPPAEREIPTNAQVFVQASSSEGPRLEVTVVDSAGERTFTTVAPSCCFTYPVDLAPLAPGPVTVTFTPPDGEPFTANYTVVDVVDEVPPTIGDPVLTFEPYVDGSYRITFANAAASELDDDHAVTAVAPRWNRYRQRSVAPGLVPDPDPEWELERLLVGDEAIAEGSTQIYDPGDLACVQLIAIDVGGNQAASELVCRDIEEPSVLEPFEALAATFGADCACVSVYDEAPVSLAALAAPLVTLAAFARRRRRSTAAPHKQL